MFEERNECGCYRNNLFRRHVHVVNFGSRNQCDVGGSTEERLGLQHFAQVFKAGCLWRATHQHALGFKCSVGIQRSICLSKCVVLFFVGCHVNDLIGDNTVDNFAIWALDETEFVHASKGAECTNETNVWTFWCFNWAHTSVVREVDVSYFKASAFTAETTGSEC